MSNDGRSVANFILDVCATQGRSVTNLSLQKIVYFCHVWSLIELGRPLVKQQFEAWQYGPVLQYLYREFKAYDRAPITERATALDRNTGERRLAAYNFDRPTTDLLHRVVNFYSRLSASQLVELSHIAGGPWEQVWNHGGSVNPGMRIDDRLILDFYQKSSAMPSLQ